MPTDMLTSSDSAWISRQVRTMALAWSRGERVLAEDVLARFPGLGDEETVRLIYEEVSLRREAGEDVATTEVINRFPRYKDELEVLLGCDRMLRPFSRVALFPTAPGELGPFRLLSELGRGASGTTYLAAEPALGDRLVVLKIVPDDQEEHLSLARLQHTHIIPLYSEQSFPDRGLRALCMPYLRGASLARVLDLIAEIPPAARQGRHLVGALDRAQASIPIATASDGPYRRYLERASYVDAICWIMACLADGLQSAHAHGLVHLDVKPSNVLIAGDGLPMLLDFHLARRPVGRGELVTGRLGGTPGWMAPEHRAAMEAVSRGEAVSEPVDERADIFALGLLLREALAGPEPSTVRARDGQTAARWPRRNPQVSVGLADIVEKCLAPRSCDRYQTAAALAGDLRRHLTDRPLLGVANRSLAEAWRKWRRRRPAALSRWAARLAIVAALAVVLCAAQVFYRHRLQLIANALDDGQRLRLNGRLDEALRVLAQGRELALSTPAAGKLLRSVAEQLALARRGQRAEVLHELAERVRFRYGALLPVDDEAQAIANKIGALWNQRGLLLGHDYGPLDSRTEESIKADLLDLAIAYSELRAGLGFALDAHRILDEAEAACGPSARLERERRISGAGPDAADRGAVRSAPSGTEEGRRPSAGLDCRRSLRESSQCCLSLRESTHLSRSERRLNSCKASPTAKKTLCCQLAHFDVARADLHAGRFREAAVELEQVLAERPQDFWPNFYAGLCAYRLGWFEEAHAAFRICVALAPDSAECYFNRARAAEAIGRFLEAERDYNRAVELDPNLTPALLNRAVLLYKQGRYDQAIADLDRALESATDNVITSQIQYNLALLHFARGDRAAAFAHAREAAKGGHKDAAALVGRLRRGP